MDQFNEPLMVFLYYDQVDERTELQLFLWSHGLARKLWQGYGLPYPRTSVKKRHALRESRDPLEQPPALGPTSS